MKYWCTLFIEREKFAAYSERETQVLIDELRGYDAELHRNGHRIITHLVSPAAATTLVTVRNKKLHITDSPLVTKQGTMIGFHLINAKDLNEAILLASRNPLARLGWVEVIPLEE